MRSVCAVSGKKHRDRDQHGHHQQQQHQQPQQFHPVTGRPLHGPPVLRPSSRDLGGSSGNLHRRASRDNLNMAASPSSAEDGGAVPSYMRSTSSSTKKEKPVSTGGVITASAIRRRPSLTSPSHQPMVPQQPQHAQSTSDLRQISGGGKDEDTSSEDNVRGRRQGEQKPTRMRRSSSQDR